MAWTPPSDAIEAQQPTTSKGWTPPSDAVEAKPAAKQGVLEKSVGDYTKKQEERVTGAGAFTASYLESMGATPGALAGARAGMAIPQPTWSKPVTGVVGGVIGGYLASEGITSLEGLFDKVFGTDIVGTREQQRQQYPGYSLAGSVTGGSLGPFMRPGLPQTIKEAAVGSGVMTGIGMGQRAIEGQPVLDPKSMAIDAATGAFTKPTKLGKRVLGHTPAPTKPKTPDKEVTPPPPGATPEQVETFKAKVKEEKAKRDAKAPLVEAAIRNKKTGEIERMGPKHDPERKAETIDTHDQGFVDERGNFHTREAAVDQAKRAGQIPEDHVLENPPGELPGLHSGDLRKAGDERFAVTEDQPAGVPSNTRPVTLDDKTPPKYLYHGTRAEPVVDADGNLVLKPAKNFGGKTNSVSLTHNQDIATDYAVRRKGKGSEGLSFTGAKVIKIYSDALPEGISRESGEEWAFNTDKPVVIPKGKFEVIEHPLAKDTIPHKDFYNWAVEKYGESDTESKFGAGHEGELRKEFLQEIVDTPDVYLPKEVEQAKAELKAREDINKIVDDRSTGKYEEPPVEWNKFKAPSSPDELAAKTSEPVAKAFEKVDPRSMPSEEEMIKHATDIHERFGEEEAVKFFDDYQKDLNERSIPVPNNTKELDDALHKVNTFETKDRSEHTIGYKENTDKGVTDEDRAKWFDMRERGEELPPEAKAILDGIDAENIALVRKIKAMGGDVGDEFATGQSRIRLFDEKERPGWKETIKEFFSNKMSFGDKVAEQANAAIERKVFGLDVWSGLKDSEGKPIAGAGKGKSDRVIEMHRHPEDAKFSYTDSKGNKKTVDVKKGTSIWEWRNGERTLLGHSDKLDLKRGDTLELRTLDQTPTSGKEGTGERHIVKAVHVIADGAVPNIEKHSPYRYWHDAEASARLANMGLRKMARELELVNNLKQSKLFETVGFSPDKPAKDLPKGWIVPNNIDRIPELRGWHFDPKTAAIISDFAKVWDNTMWMKATNAIVKNMMLNPVPHMFNEVMHLWNARGFTGWVDPRRLGTFADTARIAWRDVGNQTQFYRDIMREGGSILGADPRNKHFEAIQKEAQKQMFETPEMQRSMKQLAKKLGTTVGDLYNGISNASNKAMWFTRDVMYVQYIREIMARQEKSTGVKMELKDAIAEAERHMPNYRMPSEVLGSRGLAWTLKNPNIALFSRYHYGMVKSLVNTIKDVDPRNLKTPEGRAHFREGVDSMLAIGVAMGVLYPMMDEMAEAIFGEGAEQRRAGPYHLLKAGMDVYEGKKDISALVWPVFTFNPVLLTLGQLAINKKIFTGKPIYHPDDEFEDIAGDVGEYAVKQVPQVSPVMSAVGEEEGGTTKLLARQLDIKAKTEKELAREKRAKELQAKAKKSRDTKRAKGTYNP
jgi:hypothetical protein